MKIVKRLFIAVIVLLLLVVGALVAIPYLYKDEIVALVKDEINNQVNAEVAFGDINLSLIKSFPDFSVGLNDLQIDGVEEFEGVRLLDVESFDMTLDVWSVYYPERPVELKSLNLEKPKINVQVLSNGKANYDIMKPSEPTTPTSTEEAGDFLVQLSEYTINDGSIIYNDKSADLYMDLEQINHSGKGDFTSTIFDLVTKTNIAKTTFRTGGISYLSKAKTNLDATFNIDMDQSKYTLKDNDLRLNALRLITDGFVQMKGDDIVMDLKFNAPSNQFKDILSLIPGAYIEGYEAVKVNGTAKLAGFVKGTYNGAKEKLPAFKFDMDVKDGTVKYPDLPLGIDNIQMSGTLNSPASDLDKMVFEMPRFMMKVDQNPVEARMKLSTMMSDPNIDTKINGAINLDDLAKAFPMEGVDKLTGLILADITMNASMSAMDKQDYENIDMSGDLRISDLDYNATGMPPTHIEQLKMNFTPNFVQVDNFDAKLGESDIKATGKIDNLLAWFSPEKTMEGDMVVRSNFFDANEWMGEEEATDASTSAPADVAEEEVFDRFNFNIDAEIGKIVYDVYELKGNRAIGNFTPSKMTIKDFKTNIGDSDIAGNGTITNVFNYLFEDGTLGGKMVLNSKFMNLNQFMEEAPTGEAKAVQISNKPEELEPLLIPDNIEMDIDANMDKVIYTNMELKDVDGKLVVADEQVRIKDAVAKTLGGSFKINGGYNTQNPEKPTFDLNYNLNKLDVQKSFKTFNTMQIVAPIAEFIEGRFNSSMSMKGAIGKDMMPDMNTLTIDGFMETVNAVLKSFKPLEEVGNKLNMDYFKTMTLKNSKNWFEIKDGKFLLKESPMSFKGIDMKVKGAHGFDSDMAYELNARIPREMLEKNAVGQAAGKGLQFLKGEASKYGININEGTHINMLINLTGSMMKPKVSIKPLGADGKTDLVTSVKDQVVAEVKEVVEEKKEEVKAVIEEKKEDYKAKADAEVKIIMDKARKESTRIKREAKKLADKAKERAYTEADKAVEKVGSNPIKKLAAKKAAEIAKKQADKAHAKALAEAQKKADLVMKKAEDQSEKVREKYSKM